MTLGIDQLLPILGLCALYVGGFVLPSFGLAPNYAKRFLGSNAMAVGAAIKFLPVLMLGWMLLQRSGRAATPKAERFAKYIGIGLVFGALGDLALDFADAVPLTFLLGLGSFLIGHIFYCVAFRLDKLDFTAVPTGVFVAVPAVLLRVLWPHLPNDMIGPVIVYGITLASMGLLSASRSGVPARSYAYGLLGSIVFIASDSILAIDRFRQKLPYGKLAVMLTYYTAQILIAKCGAEYVAEDVKQARWAARTIAEAKASMAESPAPKAASPAKTKSRASSPAPKSAAKPATAAKSRAASPAPKSAAKPKAATPAKSRAASPAAKSAAKPATAAKSKAASPSPAPAARKAAPSPSRVASAKKPVAAKAKASKSPARASTAAASSAANAKRPSRSAATTAGAAAASKKK